LSGCTALTREVLVDERARPTPPNATTVSHCSGSEWQDNSMMAVVPIPIIGFGMPTQQTNVITADDVLSKCGPPDRLVNRKVEVDRTACVPTVLTRVISFGVWQWCPANVSWDADVIAPAPPPEPAGAVVAPGPQPAEFAPRGSFRAHVGLTVLAACTATSLQETARLSGAGGVVFAEADRHAGHLPHRSLTLATTPPSASRRRRSR